VRLFADIPPRGRWVLLGCLVCQMGLGASYVFGPMLKSIVADLGWSRAGFSAGRGPLILAMSLSFPLVGALADRFGPRRVLSASVISMALAFFLMSRMDQRWEFYLINALLGLSLAGLGDIVVGAVAARWVAGGRGLALAVVYLGSNLGGALWTQIGEAVRAAESWRTALVAVGGSALVLILPFAAWVVRDPPPGYRPAAATEDATPAGGADLDLPDALRTRSFWILGGVLFAFYFYYVGLIDHLVPYLSDIGYSDARAVASFSFAVLVGIAGKLGMGLLADRIPVKTAVIGNFAAVTAASLLLFGAAEPALLTAFLVLQGFATAAENVLLPLLVAACFGARHLARIYGALMVTLFAGVLGQVFAGGVFDRMGSYVPAFAVFAGLNLLALAALTVVRDERAPAAELNARSAQWT
jgi:MFS family permease